MRKSRPALFKWRHFEPAVITCAVGWYLRFSLSYRNVEELLTERGLPADHTTIWRWVQCYAPELNQRFRREQKPTNGSWRVDETYVSSEGQVGLPIPRRRFHRGLPLIFCSPRIVTRLPPSGSSRKHCVL